MAANAGGGSGYFEFGTNIEQIRQTIVSNLNAISEAASRPFGAGASPLTGFSNELTGTVNKLTGELDRLGAQFRSALGFNGGSANLGLLGGTKFLPEIQKQLEGQFAQLRSAGAQVVATNPELAPAVQSILRSMATSITAEVRTMANTLLAESSTQLGISPDLARSRVVGTGLGSLDTAARGLGNAFSPAELERATAALKTTQQVASQVAQGVDKASASWNSATSAALRYKAVLDQMASAVNAKDYDRAFQLQGNLVQMQAADEAAARNADEGSANADRKSQFFQQLGQPGADAYATKSLKYGISGSTGLIDLGSGRVVSDEKEIRVALQQLSNELRNVQLQGQNAKKSLADAFGEGFFGVGGSKYRGNARQAINPLLGFAETAGVVAKYGLQAQALFGLEREARQVAGNYAQLSEAQEQLGAIMGEGTHVSDGYINSLQNLSVVAGEGVVAALRAAQIGVAAFSNETDSTAKRLDIGATFNSASVQLGQISGASLTQSAESEVAIGGSFGLSATELPRIANAVAVAFEKFGANRTQVTDGLREIAQAGQEAGFSLEQLAQVVGLVQARTAESGTTIAGSLGRIFSLIQGNQGQKLLGGLGIDTTQSVAQQIQDLGAKWAGLSQRQREALVSTLGGQRSLKELVPLLSQNAALQDAFKASITDTNAAQRQQDAIINSVVGQLRIFAQTLRNIGQDIARSGIATPFGILLKSLQPILDLTDRLLQQWDALPGLFKGVTATVLELVVALRLAETTFGQAALGSVVGGIRGLGAAVGIGGAATVAAESGGAAGDVVRLYQQGKGVEALAALQELDAVTRRATVAVLENVAATEAETEAKVADAAATGAEGAAGAVDVAGRGGRLGGLLGLGAVTGGGLAIAGVAAALVTVVGTADAWLHLSETAKKADKYITSINDLQGTDGDIAGSLESAAIGLSSTATKLKDQANGPFGAIANFFSGNQFSGDARLFQSRANQYSGLAQEITNEQQAASSPKAASDQFFNGTSSVLDSLKLMGDRGYTSSQQIEALAHAVGLLGDTAGGAKNILVSGGAAPGLHGTTSTLLAAANAGLAGAVAPISSALRDPGQLQKLAEQRYLADAKTDPATASYDSAYAEAVKSQSGLQSLRDKLKGKDGGLDVKSLVDHMASTLSDLGKFNNGKLLTDQDQQKLAQVAGDALAPQLKGVPDDLKKNIIAGAVRAIEQNFGVQGSGTSKIATNADLSQFVNGVFKKDGSQKSEGVLDQLAKFQPTAFDASGGAAQLGLIAKIANKAIADAQAAGLDKTDFGDFNTLIAKAQDAAAKAVEAKVADLENVRKALDSRTSNANAIFGNDIKQHLAEVQAVLSNPVNGQYDVKDLAAIIGTMTQQESNQIKATLETAVRQTQSNLKAALLAMAELNAEIASILAIPGGIINHDPAVADARNAAVTQQRGAQAKVDAAQAAANAAAKSLKAYASALTISPTSTSGPQGNFDPTAVKEARDAAQAIPGDKLSQARADLNVARDALGAAKKNSVEYWNAVKQLNDAKYQFAEAERDHENNAELLKIDLTDPVAKARAELDDARRKLAEDSRRGADTSGDKVDVEDKTAALAKTKFDQRLQDEQTAYDLKRISGAQYLQFLDKQDASLRAQLAGMKKGAKGYRQLLDELNSVDQAILGLSSSLDSQFNLGDIKIPTVYDVRRETAAGGAGMQASIVNHTNNTVTINGADFDKLKAFIVAMLGPDATSRVGSTQRKA